MSIPTVRLDDPDRTRAAQTLRSACVDYGFFYLEGHGISPSLFEQVMHQSKSLFDVSLDTKQKLCDPVMSRGYTAFEEETLDPVHQRKGDTKEGFYIGTDVSESSPEYNPSKLRGPNVWPTKEILGDGDEAKLDCDVFRSTTTKYLEETKRVGFRLVQLLALAIGLEDEHYFDDFFFDPVSILRLLHYAAEPSQPEDGVFACGGHSDYGMLTLLLTDDTPGLQILTKQEVWLDVPPKKHAFVVNLGDMLERWTNGTFRSTVHRVLTKGDKERYSIPVFYEPNFDTNVTCLEVCCSPDNPPKYPPITSGQYLLGKYKQTHADFDPNEKKS